MTENTQPQINLQDLTNAVTIIDYAVSQGIVKSWADFENIKSVRDKLETFVKAATPLQETVQEPEEQKQNIEEAVKEIKKSKK